MTIREFAKSVGFEVIGKLKRHPDLEVYGLRAYLDEAENEYYINKNGRVTIITADGGVI